MNYEEGTENEFQILKDYERLNIDIPTNKEIVREYYK